MTRVNQLSVAEGNKWLFSQLSSALGSEILINLIIYHFVFQGMYITISINCVTKFLAHLIKGTSA